MSSRHTYLTFPSQPSALLVQESWWRPLVWLGWVGLVYQAAWVGVYLTSHPFCSPHESYPENWPQNYMSVSCESGFWTTEKWKVKKKCHSLFSRSASEFFLLEIEIEKWKWNENDWKSRSRSESEMKKLRDREVKFLENFREFKKDRFWSIGKGAFGGYIISLCNLLMLTI